MMSKKVGIVGAGHAAGQVVASLRQNKYAGKIVLIGDEEHYPYQRPPLSKKFLAGKIPAERLYVKPPAFYDDPDIDVRLNTRVTNIDPAGKVVTDSNGRKYGYDDLVIATGARVRKLDLPGSGLAGIHYLRNIQDVTALQRDMRSGARLVIVGAGYIGLEVAAVAASNGLQVTVVEMEARVMSRVVSEQVSSFYQSEHRKHGVDLRLSTGLSGFSGRDAVAEVTLSGDAAIAQVLANGTRRMAVHAEDDERLKQRFHLAREAADVAAHPRWRDVRVAVLATKRLLKMARGAGRRVHVLHVSTGDEMALLAEYRDIATVEVTPQHLTLAAPDCYRDMGTRAQMNPPIRHPSHRGALSAAAASGLGSVGKPWAGPGQGMLSGSAPRCSRGSWVMRAGALS